MTSEPLRYDQTLCWNCEEAVHILASQCPYCHATMKHGPKTTHMVSSGDKITPLPPIPSMDPTAHSSKEDEPSSCLGNMILSLLLLFGGCNLLFLGILVGLFSRDGFFTISWAETHWPLYFGAGLSALAFGLIALRTFDSKKE